MENVLVVKTELLRQYINRDGLIMGCENEVVDIINKNFEFLPRPEAEEDPSYKQIIPYVLICRGDEVFATRRLNKGGESRLHGLISLGVGGHINPETDGGSDDALMKGLWREIEEEVYITKKGALEMKGLINDDSNGVGSVHLGFLFTLETSGEVSVRETEKLSGEWIKRDKLRELAPKMETWSQIALNAVL